jgi:hypothetical protein
MMDLSIDDIDRTRILARWRASMMELSVAIQCTIELEKDGDRSGRRSRRLAAQKEIVVDASPEIQTKREKLGEIGLTIAK